MTVTESATSATTGLGRSAFANRMKDHYLKAWPDYVNNMAELLKLLGGKVGTIIGGKRSLTSVMTAHSQSAGIAFLEDGDLATPRTPSYLQLELIARALNIRVRHTGHVERAARAGNAAVFAKPVKEQLASARKEHARNKNRMFYLGPVQGLATCQSITNATPAVATLYGRNARNSGTNHRHKFGAHYLRENMSVAIVTSSTDDGVPDLYDPVGYSTERYVDSIDTSDVDNPTVTLDGTVGDLTSADNGALIVPWGSRSASLSNDQADSAAVDSLLAGVNGLFNLIVTADEKTFVYGASRSTNASLEGQKVVGSVAGTVEAFDEDKITLACDLIGDSAYTDGEEPDCIVCHSSVRREFISEAKGDRRFKPVQTERGFGKLVFNAGGMEMPLVRDRDCPPGLMFVLNKKSFGWFEEAPMHMPDGGERFVSDKDAREIVMVESGNLATKSPASNAIIDDIEYSTSGLVAA